MGGKVYPEKHFPLVLAVQMYMTNSTLFCDIPGAGRGEDDPDPRCFSGTKRWQAIAYYRRSIQSQGMIIKPSRTVKTYVWSVSTVCNHCFPFQQAEEMVQEILRERDHGGFNERHDHGSRMGGGMDVSLCVCVWWLGNIHTTYPATLWNLINWTSFFSLSRSNISQTFWI